MTADHPSRVRTGSPVRITAYVILALWAVFWTFFSVAEMIGGEPGAWSHTIFPILPIAVLVSLTIARPQIGAIALIAAGVIGVAFLDHTMTRVTLALPPIITGVLLLGGRLIRLRTVSVS